VSPTPSILSVAICGAGAVGGSYAERLHDFDPACLVVVARGERRQRLERDGLTVNGRRLPVRCLDPGRGPATVDLLLFGVKQHHLDEAIADARGLVDERTVILSLLNGVASEGALGRAFGAEKVLPAFVIGNDVVREGRGSRTPGSARSSSATR
jgi:2-dehydropantoate 2-reductase